MFSVDSEYYGVTAIENTTSSSWHLQSAYPDIRIVAAVELNRHRALVSKRTLEHQFQYASK